LRARELLARLARAGRRRHAEPRRYAALRARGARAHEGQRRHRRRDHRQGPGGAGRSRLDTADGGSGGLGGPHREIHRRARDPRQARRGRHGHVEVGRSIDGIPDMLAFLLGQESWDDLAARYGDRRCYWFVGGGPNTATALEAALKMSEASHAPALGFNCEQFLHGAWAALEREDVLVVIAPPGPSHERCSAAARVARAVGAPVVAPARGEAGELGGVADETIALPEIDELLSPILTIVPLQLFIYHTAVHRGVNPDLTRADDPAYGRARSTLSL